MIQKKYQQKPTSVNNGFGRGIHFTTNNMVQKYEINLIKNNGHTTQNIYYIIYTLHTHTEMTMKF